jgi:hypothetical protein
MHALDPNVVPGFFTWNTTPPTTVEIVINHFSFRVLARASKGPRRELA